MSPWVVPALSFLAAVLLVAVILWVLDATPRRVGRRLRAIRRGGGPVPEQQRARPHPLLPLTSVLERSGRYSALEQKLRRAGLSLRPGELAVMALCLFAALVVLGWLAYRLPGAAIGAVLGVGLPAAALELLAARRLRKFEEQLPDALMLIATSLRSGYGILRSLQAVRDEMAPPMSTEFQEVLDETSVGAPLRDALVRLASRVPLVDLDIAVTAILIQSDVGGNLAELMETVAATVRERRRLRAEQNALTAEARLSGVVLFAVPLGMAVALAVLNPGYMSVLFHTSLGQVFLACAAALQLVGALVIRRMLRLDF
jgi:tight adherence protein B